MHKALLGRTLGIALVVAPLAPLAAAPLPPVWGLGVLTQEQASEDLDYIIAVVEEEYAPLAYKQKKHDFDWAALKNEYREKVGAEGVDYDKLTTLLQEFVAKLQDAHTSAFTIRSLIANGFKLGDATLGFVAGRELRDGKSVAVVERVFAHFFGERSAPIAVGDVIVSVNGKAVDDVVREEITPVMNLGHDEANLAVGYRHLAERDELGFGSLPQGEVALGILRGGDAASAAEIKLAWVKTDWLTLHRDPGSSGSTAPRTEAMRRREIVSISPEGQMRVRAAKANDAAAPLPVALRSDLQSKVRNQLAMLPQLGLQTDESEPLPFRHGPKNAFPLPMEGLDIKLWPTGSGLQAILTLRNFVMDTIYCEDSGEDSSWWWWNCRIREGEDYARVFARLQALGVKNIVVDLRHNGGGFLSAANELTRAFAPQGAQALSASVRLNESWIGEFRWAAEAPWLTIAAREGYKKQLKILEDDIAAKKALSSPIALSGTDALPPVSGAWTGNTVLITDELCASACDIYSAMMQDEGLATIVGRRTMGAGGNIIFGGISPHAKVAVTQTASLLYRKDGSLIENNGVTPEVTLASSDEGTVWEQLLKVIK